MKNCIFIYFLYKFNEVDNTIHLFRGPQNFKGNNFFLKRGGGLKRTANSLFKKINPSISTLLSYPVSPVLKLLVSVLYSSVLFSPRECHCVAPVYQQQPLYSQDTGQDMTDSQTF